jgi:hypothetical protein
MSLSTQSSTKKHVSTPPVLLLTRVVRYNDNSVERGRLAVVSVLAMPIPPLQASLLPAPPFTPLTPPIVLALPPCLLPHQLDAIHDFFICLLAQTDMHGCSTCHERFRGIRMRDAQCERSARSPRPPSLPLSLAHLLTTQRLPFSPKKHGDFSDVSHDLHAILEGLTQMEEMCAASPLPAFSCGSARVANTRAGETSLYSPRTLPLFAQLSLDCLRTSTYLSFESRT